MRALTLLVAAAACPRAAALVVYYNVFSKNVATAVEIVYEQLTELRAAPIWNEVDEIRYSTIGKGKMRNHVARICREVNATCRRLRLRLDRRYRGAADRRGESRRRRGARRARPRPDPEEQTELQYDRGRVANAVWRGAPRVVAPVAEVPADVRRARAGAEALAKRSDDGVGVNPSVFTYR